MFGSSHPRFAAKRPTDLDLAELGERYHVHRKELMRALWLGLTKIYNFFHARDLSPVMVAAPGIPARGIVASVICEFGITGAEVTNTTRSPRHHVAFLRLFHSRIAAFVSGFEVSATSAR